MNVKLSILLTLFVIVVGAMALEQSVSAIYNGSHLNTTSGSYYALYSPGASYSIRTGSTVGFLGRSSFIFPRGLHQDGKQFSYSDYYESGLGIDMLFAVSYKKLLSSKVALFSSIGVHINGSMLTSNEYEAFNSLTSGFGLEIQFLYRLNELLSLGGFIDGAVDFKDHLHDQNRLDRGYFFTSGISLTFHSKKKEEKDEK